MYQYKKILYKRINRESERIISKYKNYTLDELPDTGSLQMIIEKKNLKIRIVFPEAFPFRQPTVFLNNKNYRDLLNINIDYVSRHLKKIGIKCLCCKSILCTENWIPCHQIMDILNEIDNNHKLVKKIILTHYIEIICQKNNIQCQELINHIVNFL